MTTSLSPISMDQKNGITLLRVNGVDAFVREGRLDSRDVLDMETDGNWNEMAVLVGALDPRKRFVVWRTDWTVSAAREAMGVTE